MRSFEWTLTMALVCTLQVSSALGQATLDKATLGQGAPAQATPAQNRDKALSLTVYNKDLALIEHVRPVNLPAGRHRIEFKGVSARIVPETVGFGASGLQLIEQNFDYDLLTPGKLMEKAVGQTVRIVRTNPGTGAETSEVAEVLSTSGGVVLRIGTRIEVLRDDGIPARVIFDKVPDNLRASPTLSVLANAAKPVNGDLKLTYLSRGISWSSDYVAVFEERAGEVELQGWITLNNQSGTSFENARVQLIAGDINVVGNEEQWWQRYNSRRVTNATRRGAGTETTSRQQLADYYVYPIAQLTTVANAQTKQVSFLSAAHVKASKGYEQTYYGFESNEEPQNAEVRVRFTNSKLGGLSEQLPSGIVRVYARDSRGQPQFIGEDRIGHTSAGSELALKIGEAFDVTVQPTLVSANRISRRNVASTMTYLVRNARATPVTVTLRQRNLWRFNEVTEESQQGRRTDADSFAWDIAVPANGEKELRVTIRQWW